MLFEKKIDELYELCKRVKCEAPEAYVSFSLYNASVRIIALRKSEDIQKPIDEFEWDLDADIYLDSEIFEKSNNSNYEKARTFLLELLINGRCPLNESNG